MSLCILCPYGLGHVPCSVQSFWALSLFCVISVSRLNPRVDEVSQASDGEVLRDPVKDRKGSSQKGRRTKEDA